MSRISEIAHDIAPRADRNRRRSSSSRGVRLAIAAVFLAVMMGAHSALPARAAGTVSTCNESSLRGAVTSAAPGDTITFVCSGAITLSAAGGPVVLDKNLTIDGSGQAVTVSGGGSVGVFEIVGGVSVTLSHLTIADGANGGSSVAAGGYGTYGGVLNAGTLNLDHSAVSGNVALDGAGGIRNLGTLNISASTISGNTGLVAGIHQVAGTLNITDSTLDGNIGATTTVSSTAGAIVLSNGTATVTSSTLTANRGQMAGGISLGLGTTLAVTNSTLSGNSSTDLNSAGAIRNDLGTLSVINSTVVGNSAPFTFSGASWDNAGGIAGLSLSPVVLKNTVLAGNNGEGGGNCFGLIFDGANGGNLSDDASCSTTGGFLWTTAAALNLGPLSDNGGPTQTIALGPGSVAIDHGSCLVVLDQRGFPRPGAGGTECDSGAFEVQDGANPAEQTISFGPLVDRTFGDPDFTISATASSGLDVTFGAAGDCSVSGTTVHITAAGTCTIDANQGGNTDYLAAPHVSQSFAVLMRDQTITVVASAPASAVDGSSFTVAANASSGLPVAYATSGACTNAGAIVTMAGGSGACTVTYSQEGDSNFNPATPVNETVIVAAVAADETPPTISAAAMASPNAAGWYNADVVVRFTCFDADSGIPEGACPADQVLTGEGNGISSFAMSVTDAAGNTSAASNVVTVDIDRTAPVVSATRAPLANGAGWNNTAVTVSYLCSDALAGVASAGADDVLASEGANQSASGSCTDLAGNTASTTVSGINIDSTAPSVGGSASPAPNAAGWNTTAVTVSYVCSDVLAGVASSAAEDVLASEGANQAASGSCTDLAGNTASTTVSGINIDFTAPGASTSQLPAANANGWNNTEVTVSFTCVDALSDIDDPYPAPLVLAQDGAGQLVAGICYDRAGNSAVAARVVSIDQAAPAVTITSPVDLSVNPVGTPLIFSAGDALSGLAASSATVSNGTTGGSAPVTNGEVLQTPGVYILTVVGSDLAGNEATRAVTFVVYDPSEGFVTGGGWIMSPAGACQFTAGCAATAGKATFGFVSRYKKGASIPTGTTQFEFRNGEMIFESISYEWLVVGGARAQYKGVGAINGAAGYGFMLTAIDSGLPGGGGSDTFRIKIWDTETGGVVYDNQMGAGDNTDPATALGGGSIIIHK